MAEMIEENDAGSSTESLPTSIGHSKRRATDRYWMVLFVIAIIIWSVPWPQAEPYELVDNNNNTLANTTFECVETKPLNKKITEATSLYVSNVLGKNWLLDVITCNAGLLDTSYNRSGLVVIWAHVLFYACLLLYIFTSMRSDELYKQQFFMLIMTLIGVSVLTQELIQIQYIANINEILSSSDFLLHILLWFMPEAILFIIGRTIRLSTKQYVSKKVDDNDDDNVNANNDNDNRETVNLTGFMAIPFGISCVIFYMILTLALPVMFGIALDFRYRIMWSSERPVGVIVIASICYVILVIYYFLLMITSCLTSIRFRKLNRCKLKDFVSALRIVARYHFGTVCYNATLIFPRIHATFIINEKEFRGDPKVSAIYRLYLTHWKYPNLSPILTAARGYNHSETVRELMRLAISDSPKLKKLQSFNQIRRSCSLLLMAIYGLLLISLWTHGVTINPGFTTSIWLAYLIAIFITTIITRILDAVADVLWYLDDGTVIINF